GLVTGRWMSPPRPAEEPSGDGGEPDGGKTSLNPPDWVRDWGDHPARAESLSTRPGPYGISAPSDPSVAPSRERLRAERVVGEGEVRNQCREVGPLAEAPRRGLRREEYGVPEAGGARPPQGPDRSLGLVLGRRRGPATARNLVAEGVPAGRGEP